MKKSIKNYLTKLLILLLVGVCAKSIHTFKLNDCEECIKPVFAMSYDYYDEFENVEPVFEILNVIEEAQHLFKGYFFEEALDLLNSDERLIGADIKAMETQIKEAMDNLELYEGHVKHIFFHSLVLYPEYLFPDISIPTGGFNEGFIFRDEFKRLLPQLYERGYVLFDINDVFGVGPDGTMIRKEIWLPPEKMPLILSLDDPSYHYGIGFANALVVDEHGDLKTEIITPEKETIYTNDGDIPLIINNFVKENPDFSWRGNTGLIAATGFMGIFGHDLYTEESIQMAKDVAEKLKETGWKFANHSYTHQRVPGWWSNDADIYNIKYDIGKWRETKEPIVGETNVFIAPFGIALPKYVMEVFTQNGYNIYNNVDFNQPVLKFPDYIMQGRIEIGGYSLNRWTNYINEHFFDVDSVIDEHRPPIISQ